MGRGEICCPVDILFQDQIQCVNINQLCLITTLSCNTERAIEFFLYRKSFHLLSNFKLPFQMSALKCK